MRRNVIWRLGRENNEKKRHWQDTADIGKSRNAKYLTLNATITPTLTLFLGMIISRGIFLGGFFHGGYSGGGVVCLLEISLPEINRGKRFVFSGFVLVFV